MASNSQCGPTATKYILIVFSILYFIGGALIVGMRSWMYTSLQAKGGLALDVAFIVVGSFLFLVGLIGCIGACKESSCLLNMFAVLLVIILIVKVAAITAIIVILKEAYEDALSNALDDVQHYSPNTNSGVDWPKVQSESQCCGANDYKDYIPSLYTKDTKKPVPETCCKLKKAGDPNSGAVDYVACQAEAINKAPKVHLYSKGCYELNIGFKYIIFLCVYFTIILTEVCGIIMACYIKKQLSEYSHV